MKIVAALLLFVSALTAAAQRPACTSSNLNASYIDSVNNVQYLCTTSGWKANVGNGAPAAGCSAVNYGALYTNLSTGQTYTCATSGWTLSGGGSSSSSSLGVIYSASTFPSVPASFTTNGATVSASGGTLNFSGGASTFTQTLDYTQTTLLPQSQICGNITIGSSSDSLGFGWRSNAAGGGGSFFGLAALYTQSTGKLTIYTINNTTGSLQATSAGTITSSVADSVTMCVSRNFNVFTVTANDLTTQSPQISASYTFGMFYQQSALIPNAGRFAIFSYGGTPSLASLTISSVSPVSATVAILGDSKTAGYYAGTYQASFGALLQNNYTEVTLAGGSNQTQDMINELPEALSLKPAYAIIGNYRNDTGVCTNTAPAQTTANLTSVYNSLVSGGVKAYFLIGMWEPSGTCNQTAIWNWITTNYPNNYIQAPLINYSATPSTVLVADNVHPNAFGHTLIAQAIQSSLSALQAQTNFQNYLTWQAVNNSAISYASITATTNLRAGPTIDAVLFSSGYCNATNGGVGSFCINQAKTGGSNVTALTLATNESSNQNALQLFYTGSGTVANRKWQLQTQEVGSSNTGVLDLQPFGGTINMGGGGNTVLRCTVAGTLPVGALTVNAANCGATATTALSVN